jgi:hypothetical protein
MHLREQPKLKAGDKFSKGQAMPVFTGNTGPTTGPHLHLAAERGYDGAKRIDPAQILCDIGATGFCRYIMDSGGDRARSGKASKAWKKEEARRLKRWANNPNNPANKKPKPPPKTLPLLGEPEALEEGRLSTKEEALVRRVLREAIKKKSLTEADEPSSALLYQVVLVLKVSQPIRDIKGKLNRIRAIEGVTIVSHEREEETIYSGDVVAKVKFHPPKDMMTPATFINQYLIPQINDSKIVPEVKVLKTVQGTIKEIT